MDSKSVEVTNVKWAKVMVEGVVQKAVVYRKVERRLLTRFLHGRGPVDGSL